MMGDQLSPAPLDANEERLSISQIINHPNFNPATFDNDIAVIKVRGTFNSCGTHVSPACLPNPNVRYSFQESSRRDRCYFIYSSTYSRIIIYRIIIITATKILQGYDYVGWQDTIVSGSGSSFYGGRVLHSHWSSRELHPVATPALLFHKEQLGGILLVPRWFFMAQGGVASMHVKVLL